MDTDIHLCIDLRLFLLVHEPGCLEHELKELEHILRLHVLREDSFTPELLSERLRKLGEFVNSLGIRTKLLHLLVFITEHGLELRYHKQRLQLCI